MSFEGEIGEIDLIQRLVELGSEQFTGAIRFESDGIIKIVYFKGGDILSASTNDRSDAIDEILLRAGKVTREHVKQALAKRKESETLGDALLGLGFITRKELTWARRVQVIGILRSILGWKNGSYTIVADYLPKREEGTLFPLPQIIVELTVTDNDRAKSEQVMDSGRAVFRKSADFDDAFRRLGLNEDAEQIAAEIDGTSSAAEVAARSGKDVFNVYKLLEALRLLRLLTRIDKPDAEHEVLAAAHSNVDNPDFTLDDVAPTVPPSSVQEWAVNSESQTLKLPAVKAPLSAPASSEPLVAPPSRSVWDDPTDDDVPSASRLDSPPVVEAVEPQWGFDEAQIEAARRAAEPANEKRAVAAPAPASGSGGRRSFLIPLLVLLLVAAGAYGGWVWWQGHRAPARVVAVHHAPPKLRPVVNEIASTIPAPMVTTSVAGSMTSTQTSPPPPSQTATSASTATVPAVKPAAVSATVAPALHPVAPAVRTSTAARKTPPEIVPPVPSAKPAVAAVPTDSADAVRAKYDGMARDFAAKTEGTHTLQFELVCETASITRALNADAKNVWFLPTSYRGRPCYRVFWGRFNSAAEAAAASKQLPRELGSVPVAVKIPRS